MFNEIINEIVCSSDLIEMAEHLNKFINLSPSKKDINKLNVEINRALFPETLSGIFDGSSKAYIIYERCSTASFLNSLWIRRKSAIQNIKELETIITIIQQNYTKSQGARISEDSVKQIMNYVNIEYNFYDILKGEALHILLFENSHLTVNSECVPKIMDNGDVNCALFIYHLKDECHCSPEHVFLHELGHVLQIKITGDSRKVPPSFLPFAKEAFPDIAKEIEPEVFADCFAMAVMYNSQFSVYDPFDLIAPTHKMLFQIYIQELARSNKIFQ